MKAHYLGIGILIFTLIGLYIIRIIMSQEEKPKKYDGQIWEYQCIDTMKISRDKAREMISRSDVLREIDKEVSDIASIGANCVAIGTPYDSEFIPYMKLWVRSAREKGLRVWFRGNWNRWEGWFDAPADMTSSEHVSNTYAFIVSNKDLFEDGDIFTPAPEAENGKYFKDKVFSNLNEFRDFLIISDKSAQDAFKSINKNVITNWHSLSGGVAKGALDLRTIEALKKTVTLDHYVKDQKEMTEFIRYFADKYDSKVVLGEFGAPIPDLNGYFSDQEQYQFVGQLLYLLYLERKAVKGINYWTLSGSSTAIYNTDGELRTVASRISDYYKPGFLHGSVRNTAGDLLENIEISDAQNRLTMSGVDGGYEFIYPAGKTKLNFKGGGYKKSEVEIDLARSTNLRQDVILEPEESDSIYRIREFLYKLISRG